ncbi:hypothetical protein RND71_014434 [Anisodus tanguticus]|uniref:Uncharacterized protein n=1 Tax=Anisodus tanguticus TaxID=243964 RepID=A0AAE1S938_9SOLA|nr:hypothetical protein RND71_014434 [Anisodus tanguticus]
MSHGGQLDFYEVVKKYLDRLLTKILDGALWKLINMSIGGVTQVMQMVAIMSLFERAYNLFFCHATQLSGIALRMAKREMRISEKYTQIIHGQTLNFTGLWRRNRPDLAAGLPVGVVRVDQTLDFAEIHGRPSDFGGLWRRNRPDLEKETTKSGVSWPPCCDKSNVKRGPWTAEEDAKILAYVASHGIGNWTLVPQKAGISC